MISSTYEPFRTPRVLWTGMFASLGIYAFILAFSVTQGRMANTSVVTYQVVSLLGLLTFLAGIFLPQAFIKRLKKQSPEVFASLSLKEKVSKEVKKLIFIPLVLRLGLFAATGFVGFVLAYLTINIENFYPCLILSAAGFLYNFPTQRLYRRVLGI